VRSSSLRLRGRLSAGNSDTMVNVNESLQRLETSKQLIVSRNKKINDVNAKYKQEKKRYVTDWLNRNKAELKELKALFLKKDRSRPALFLIFIKAYTIVLKWERETKDKEIRAALKGALEEVQLLPIGEMQETTFEYYENEDTNFAFNQHKLVKKMAYMLKPEQVVEVNMFVTTVFDNTLVTADDVGEYFGIGEEEGEGENDE